MPLPIYGKLTQGEKFDLDTLFDSFDDVESFWNSWWEGRDPTKIDRPETIQNGEPILTPTINKDTVDLLANAEFFNNFLSEAIDAKCFPICDNMRRQDFHEILLKLVSARSALITGGPPQIIFAGGGYGAGKTTILSKLANSDKLPLQMCHMVGVDYFKLFVPEFSLMQIVADGRASLTVRRNARCWRTGCLRHSLRAGDRLFWIRPCQTRRRR